MAHDWDRVMGPPGYRWDGSRWECRKCGARDYSSRHPEQGACGVKIASVEEIVAYLREQARLRSPENDEAGILLRHAHRIDVEVAQLDGPLPFAGLDACETE